MASRRECTMDDSTSPLPIVVSIDGSKAAVHAAIWAIDEAIRSDTPLHLVHVIKSRATPLHREYAHGRNVGQEASGRP
jgi:nucleotide-binding universal stress UspA family protein